MLRFGEFTLDPVQGRLLRGGAPVELQPKPYELLVLLTSAPGRLFARADLEAALWPDVHVTEDSLPQAVRRLRSALGDDARAPRFVENVPRRGYRWIGPLVVEGGGMAPEVRASLPRPDDLFVGRAAELAQLRAALERSRLVTVVGPGGIGKTRLALELPEVSAWCRLGAAGDTASLLSAVAEGLALPPESATADGIRAALADTRDLVLLDEAEGVVEPLAAALASWLAGAGAARFVVTSRCRLGLAAEHVVELGPLPVEDGMALYEARALAVEPGRHDPPAEVRALVSALDGWPLAIELAAARRPLLDAAGVRARLDPSLRILARPRPDRPERHRSLWATLQWSWSLLSEAEQLAAARLSAFPSGTALETAEHVLGDQDDPIALLEGLRHHCWLQRAGDDRFEQYTPLRMFAEAQRDAAGLGADATARFVAAMVARVRAHRHGPTRVLAAERANLWAAFAAATDPEDALVLLTGLVRVDLYAAESQEPLLAGFDRVLALAADRRDVRAEALARRVQVRTRSDPDGAVDDGRAALAEADDDPALRSYATRVLGLALPPGHPDRLATVEDALRLAREAGDPETEALAVRAVGMVLQMESRDGEALEALQAAVAIWRRLGAVWDEARTLVQVATAAAMVHDLHLAHRAALQALEVLDPRRDAALYVDCLSVLVTLARYEERNDDAHAMSEQQLAIGRNAVLFHPAAALRAQAEMAIEAGALDRARSLVARFPPPRAPLDHAEQAETELQLLVAERRWEEAEHNLEWRAAAYRESRYTVGEVLTACWRALLAGVRGEVADARRWSDAALARIDDPLGAVAESLRVACAAAVPFAACVAGDAAARPELEEQLDRLYALAPVGPTTGRPALSPRLRPAVRLIRAEVG